jgi:hypothetical protein
MNNSFKIKTGLNVEPKTGSTVTTKGDVAYNATSEQIEVFGASTAESITTNTNTQTLSGKSIDATTNPITNVTNASIAAAAAIARSKVASGTAYRMLANDATGVLSENAALTSAQVTYVDANGQLASEASLAKLRGGSGQDNSSLTFPATGTLGTLAGTETLSNKTFSDAPTFTQVATPSTPAAGFNKIYSKADGNFYNLNSSGIEAQIGAGAGGSGGLKNYLGTVNNVNGNGNFELGNASKWSLFNTTLTGVIPTGGITAGAASITTFAATTSGKLAGAYSLNVASSAAITAGEGFISDAFTIDTEDQAKVLAQKFAYSVVSGASNLNFSGTSSNTFAVYLYDVTNSAWVQPAGVYNLVQNSGVGLSTGTFQTASNASQYRLAVVCINASAGASSMLFDDFSVGQQITAAGAAISDWVSYTPTFTNFGTPTNVNFISRRVGDSLEIQGVWQTGLVVAAEGSITIGYNGVNANVTTSSKLSPTFNTNVYSNVGYAASNRAADSASYTVLASSSDSLMRFGIGNLSSGIKPIAASSLTNDFQEASLFARIPIAGWSSNTVMSSDTDTRVVAIEYNIATGPISGIDTLVTFSNKIADTHAAYSSGVFTAPVTGFYSLTAGLLINGTFVSGNNVNVSVYKNGGVFRSYIFKTGGAYGDITGGINVAAIYCLAGDTLAIYANTNGTGVSYNSGPTYGYLSIARLSGPATIAASDSVNARYSTAAGQSIAAVTTTIVDFGTKSFDNNAIVSTGASWKCTAPISGTYSVQVIITFAVDTFTAANAQYIELFKNGVVYSTLNYDRNQATSASRVLSVQGNDDIQLVAGDYIDIRVTHQEATARSLFANVAYNHISIKRTGN